MTAKNEALFRLGKLLGDKEGPMAEEIKKRNKALPLFRYIKYFLSKLRKD